ncbi:MAG: prolipoprotein diacylglyceryl transferase [Deltaproteobacteria bacterium]|nr:prolipoprotein diacylglyceryl transferase [Deltaproteobacteria bacterium]
MTAEMITLVVSLFVATLLVWGFKRLPKEQWQFFACIPRFKRPDGAWDGLNLTYYGIFNATAYTAGALMAIMLFSAVGISLPAAFLLIASILLVCMPASALAARFIEKKPYTFSVAGAFFIGIFATPIVTATINSVFGINYGFSLPLVPVLAATSASYALGEGIGRLACISFGCCYGKPLADCPFPLKALFDRWNFIFSGKTKKIAYAHQLDGVKVVPIQALTALLSSTAGIAAMYLFLKGSMIGSLLTALLPTQTWRVVSEFLRADYRGSGRFSKYQTMSALSILLALIAAVLLPTPTTVVDPLLGLKNLWNPGVLITMQGLWLLSFLYTGRSNVTASTVLLHVRRERI